MTSVGRISRRETLRRGLAAAGLLATIPDWATPALAQGETEVPFTDIPANFSTNRGATSRLLDIRKIDGLITPKDQFFSVQHFGRPEIDAATFRLKVTGMVKRPAEFSLADLRAMRATELVAGYPNVTVPAGDVYGLPVGISFMGRAWSEAKLIALAYAYEQATRHRHPPQFLPTIDREHP